jgi:hypothetical protein
LLPVLDRQEDRPRDAVGVRLGDRRLVGRDRRFDHLDREVVRQLGGCIELAEIRQGGLDRGRRIGDAALDGRDDREGPADERHPGIGRFARERIGERQDALRQDVRVECDLRRERHATKRGLGVGDDPLRGVARPSDPERLGDHRLDIRPAAELVVGDRRLLALRLERHRALAEEAIGLAKGGGRRDRVEA